MTDPITIAKLPLPPATEPGGESLDYSLLRQQGMDYLIALGSDLWTDFNIHDPGITFLEALCYSLTELAYRAGFSVPDLLASPPGTAANFDRQGFFTARNILTVNPWTPQDFRKLLVDVPGVKNAWLICKTCPCDMLLYAKCATSSLVYAKTEHPITIKGLYDVLLEFATEGAGDLNSGKVQQTFVFPVSSTATGSALIEMRLPSWHQLTQTPLLKDLRLPTATITGVTVQYISGNKTDAVDIPAAQLARGLKSPLYVGLQIQFLPTTGGTAETIALPFVPIKLWFNSDADRQALQLADLKTALADSSASGLIARYQNVLQTADQVVGSATQSLQAHRNLAEDFCSIDAVEVTDIGICLDLLLETDADIEEILAEAYYQIGQYFAPSVQFYSLAERLATGKPVDEIFDGPPLSNGFIDDDQLAATQLKHTLYASDVIRILMALEGVVAVENFTFVLYDADGTRDSVYAWAIEVPERHEARLYINGSKILVYKDGLTFLPNSQELMDTLQKIQGENEPSALTAQANDLPVPTGIYSNLADYFPVQYSLPETYGVSAEGLSQTSSATRKAQATQLRAYLFFFEQLLVNYLSQLKNLQQLFAINPTVTRTYYTQLIGPDIIRDIDKTLYDPVNTLTQAKLDSLAETSGQELNRRNRFLDNLLARFAEQFSDYALMLYTYDNNQAVAAGDLIQSKVQFLQNYPFISANRARAFNYKDPTLVCNDANISGLKRRIQLLLGWGFDPAEKIFIVEHMLLRPRNSPGTAFPNGDPLLPICIAPDCHLCGEEDPYSFRLTIVVSGDVGVVNKNLSFRRFAEQTIRLETPAHLALKICWVGAAQLTQFETVYCAWLGELAKPAPDPVLLNSKLSDLLNVFNNLKSVYPPATLHDCFVGGEGNEVFLGQTVI